MKSTYKLAIKLILFLVVITGITVMLPGDKVSADSPDCPNISRTGTAIPSSYGYNKGEQVDGFGGLVVASSVGSMTNGQPDEKGRTGNPIDAKYQLNSYLPNAPAPYRYNLGGNPQSDRIFTVDSSNNSQGRTNQRWFGTNGSTGDNLYAGGGGFTCPGWDSLGPGISSEIGNRHALDCGEAYYLPGDPDNVKGREVTRFWISGLPSPNGEDGQWEVQVYGQNKTYSFNFSPGSMGPGNNDKYFTIKNGATIRINLVWHAKAQPKQQQGHCNYLDVYNEGTYTNSGGNHKTRAHVKVTGVTDVSVNGGAVDSNQHGIDGYAPSTGGDSSSNHKVWRYRAEQPVITIVVVKEFQGNDGNWYFIPNNQGGWSETRTCISVQCRDVSVIDTNNRPGGIILAGDQVTVTGVIENTSPPDGPNLRFPYLSGTHGTTTNAGILGPGGGSASVSMNTTAPWPGELPDHIWHLNYSVAGVPPVTASCGNQVAVYEHFRLEPVAQLDYSSSEDPGTITYSTSIVNHASSAGSAPTASRFYTIPYSGGAPCPSVGPVNTSGPYNPGKTYIINPATCNPSSVKAGDQYCVEIKFTGGYNEGFVGPGGAVIPDKLSDAGRTPCFTVTNKPYFKAYNGGVTAGGDFKQADGSCSSGDGGGLLAGWNNNSGGVDRGAGSQLSALAMIKITGFASAQTTITRSPTGLTFANTVPADISTSADSPKLGGNYNPGGSRCLSDVTPPSGATIRPDGFVQTGIRNIADNRSVFVDGDVYISNNITYANSWATDNPPSFVLRATGNIYIAPGVTKLDGLYISKNKIYTCAVNNGGGNFAPVARPNIYNTCKNQLVVFGNFVAKKINLLRSYGSLRDEKPVGGSPATDPTPGAIVPLYYTSTGTVPGDKNDCANLRPRGGGRIQRWRDNFLCPAPADSVTKLGFTENGNTDRLKSKGLTNCTADWGEVLDDAGYDDANDWDEVFVCSNLPISVGTRATEAGKFCTLVTETDDNGLPFFFPTSLYVCVSTSTPGSPAVPPSPPAVLNCSNRGTRVITTTCAAEIFFLNPSLYYAKPAIQLPSGGAPIYDSITSLPPVL